jgi:hypothetical protein
LPIRVCVCEIEVELEQLKRSEKHLGTVVLTYKA